jgi:hypothetical protein
MVQLLALFPAHDEMASRKLCSHFDYAGTLGTVMIGFPLWPGPPRHQGSLFMTMQKRVTIEPHDIVALEYECRNCQSRYSIPVGNIRESMMKCPNCGKQWIRGSYESASPDPKDSTIPNFARYLQQLRGVASEAIIRLEISLPPPSATDPPSTHS